MCTEEVLHFVFKASFIYWNVYMTTCTLNKKTMYNKTRNMFVFILKYESLFVFV